MCCATASASPTRRRPRKSRRKTCCNGSSITSRCRDVVCPIELAVGHTPGFTSTFTWGFIAVAQGGSKDKHTNRSWSPEDDWNIAPVNVLVNPGSGACRLDPHAHSEGNTAQTARTGRNGYAER